MTAFTTDNFTEEMNCDTRYRLTKRNTHASNRKRHVKTNPATDIKQTTT